MTNSWGKLKCFTFDLRKSIQRDGWRKTGRWLAKILIELPYRHLDYIVFARSLLEPLTVARPRLPVTLCLATEADLFRFEEVVPKSEFEHFRHRLTHGRYCFLALDGENRRQGIQTAVHLYRLEYMKKLGCRRAILIVSVTNSASQRLVSKLGYQEADRLSFRRILWKRTYRYHSGKF
jgi:RimJ/RimL family protein N-acetyltransferase